MTPAETCRAKGWQVGDVLETTSGPPITIVITAIARVWILAIEKRAQHIIESTWGIYLHSWRKIGHMDPFADELVWP